MKSFRKVLSIVLCVMLFVQMGCMNFGSAAQADYTIVSFKMVEKPKGTKGSDYMQFTFSNMKRNIAIDDSVFKVQ